MRITGRSAKNWLAKTQKKPLHVRKPKAKSPGEEALKLQIVAKGLHNAGGYARDFKFHPARKWLFDFAWPEWKVAIEVEGIGGKAKVGPDGNGGIGRHQTNGGIRGDIEKYFEARMLGWDVMRITTAMAKSGSTFDRIADILQQRRDGDG